MTPYEEKIMLERQIGELDQFMGLSIYNVFVASRQAEYEALKDHLVAEDGVNEIFKLKGEAAITYEMTTFFKVWRDDLKDRLAVLIATPEKQPSRENNNNDSV